MFNNSYACVSFDDKIEEYSPNSITRYYILYFLGKAGSLRKVYEANMDAEARFLPTVMTAERQSISVEELKTKQEVEDSHRVGISINEKELFHQMLYEGQFHCKNSK